MFIVLRMIISFQYVLIGCTIKSFVIVIVIINIIDFIILIIEDIEHLKIL